MSAEDILSSQEIEAVKFAQDLYGARAKEAAASLADTLGLDDVAKGQILGGLALKLEGLDFEERRKIASEFRDISEVLGGTAITGTEPTPELVAVPLDDDQETLQNDTEKSDIEPFNTVQRTWLGRLYEVEDVQRLEKLDPEQRIVFIISLTEVYKSLKITRATPESKQQRGEQLLALMNGGSINEIARSHGTSQANLRLLLRTMAEGIKSRVPEEELRSLISGIEQPSVSPPKLSESIDNSIPDSFVDGYSEAEAKSTEAKTPLNPAQKGLLNRLYSEEEVSKIEDFDISQRTQFIHALTERYKGLKIRRLSSDAKQQRANQLESLFSGNNTYKDVALMFEDNPNNIRAGLMKMAEGIEKRVPKEELNALISNNQQETTDETIEDIEFGLTKLQRKWLEKIFVDRLDITDAELLNRDQREYLGERLRSHLKYAFRKLGPVKTAQRIYEIKLLFDGYDYDEIAENTGSNTANVKYFIHTSAQKIKANVPLSDLKGIMKDASVYIKE